MNRQQVFDQVCNHLLTQGEPAISGDDCVYRADGGLTCAVGCLISDEHYSEDFEGCNADDERVQRAVRRSLSCDLLDVDIALLVALQDIHDNYRSYEWVTALQGLAADLDLAYNGDQYGKQSVGLG